MAGNADGFAQGEAEGVCGHGIDVAENFVGEAGIIFKTGCGVGDVIFGFDDGLPGIAAFEFGKCGGVGANFLSEQIGRASCRERV